VSPQGQVVANEIGVRPPADTVAGDVDSSLDKGIKNNLDAKLTEARMDKTVDYSVKNGVVTLKGDVNSQPQRTRAADLAKSVPNVKQVVNELQIKDQKATTAR
jgi:osmotically-inducible protein OsmY